MTDELNKDNEARPACDKAEQESGNIRCCQAVLNDFVTGTRGAFFFFCGDKESFLLQT